MKPSWHIKRIGLVILLITLGVVVWRLKAAVVIGGGTITGGTIDASLVTGAGDCIWSNHNAFALSPVMATLTDADATLTVGSSAQYQILSATLTGNRTITLSTSGAVNGSTFTIIRKGLGIFTLNIGGLKTVPSATTASIIVMFDGSSWQLIGYQLL